MKKIFSLYFVSSIFLKVRLSMKKNIIILFSMPLACTLLLLAQPKAFAAQEWVSNGTIYHIMRRSDGTWGDCMIYTDVAQSTLTCNTNYWTFSCDGTFSTKAAAQSKFDMAIAAVLSGKKVHVLVNDAKQHNGYCFVEEMRIVP